MYDIKSIQNQVQQVQLESKKTLSSASDIVKVTVNGTYQIVELVLDYKQSEFVDLGEIVQQTINQAFLELKTEMAEKMNEITKGIMPNGFKM